MCMNWAETVASISPNKISVLWGSSHIYQDSVRLFSLFCLKWMCLFPRHFCIILLAFRTTISSLELIIHIFTLFLLTWFSFLCQTLEFFWWFSTDIPACFVGNIPVALSLSLMFVLVFSTHEDSCISVLIISSLNPVKTLFYIITNNKMKVFFLRYKSDFLKKK